MHAEHITRLTPHVGVIVVAAGRGERLGSSVPKAFVSLAGDPLLAHSVRTVTGLDGPGTLAVVAPASHLDAAERIVAAARNTHTQWDVRVVAGGSERDESVRAGIEAMPAETTVLLVHDAARPFTPHSVFAAVIDRVIHTNESAIPVLPVVDTIKRVGAHHTVADTLDRSELVAVQTPQGFPAVTLIAAHAHERAQQAGSAESSLPTDDAEVVQRYGGTVHTVAGAELSRKVTTPVDLTILQALLTHESEELR